MVDRMDKRKPVKLTRSEKKAMRRTEKLAVKLEKEQERAAVSYTHLTLPTIA